jgi:anti-sigma B factor antagonist
MQIDIKKEGDKLKISPKGNIDYVTAPELDAEISKVGEDVRSIELDMSEVPYISSAGLRVILNADEMMQDRDGIKLTGVNNDVRAILEMTGFYDILDIE